MENPAADETTMMKEPLLKNTHTSKGGFRTLPFIIANEALEKVASYGLAPNMILYLMKRYHMEMVSGSNILYIWSAATNFMPILGAFLADSYVGRFKTIGFGSIVSLLGMSLLWVTTVIPEAHPPPCDEPNDSCKLPKTWQLVLLCSSFGLMSVGAGGIRSSSLAFGADQLEYKGDDLEGEGNSRGEGAPEWYFSWYYALTTVSVLVAVTCVVYIQDNIGWTVGFGVPVLLMLLSVVSFFLASSFYFKLKANTSLLTGFAQVFVASYRKRHLIISSSKKTNTTLYHQTSGSLLVSPSNKLRFFNKACIKTDSDLDLASNGRPLDPWSLCTVDQVEEVKSLIKVIPIWSTGIMMSVVLSQNSFPVLQASSMDRRIVADFQIPAASFGLFLITTIVIWLPLYDRVILPLASRITRKTVYLSPRQRMGIGLFISFIAMVVTSIVEGIRRATANREGMLDSPVQMSAKWLIPQNCLCGLAEAFNAVGQNEFYFAETPKSMHSIASTLVLAGMAVGSLVASFILNTVDQMTRKGGKESWVSTDVNKGHYDYYYMLLAGLSLLNAVYFVVCCKAYGRCEGERSSVSVEGDDDDAAEQS